MSLVQTNEAEYRYGDQLNIICPVLSSLPAASLVGGNLPAGQVVPLGSPVTMVGISLEPINANSDPPGVLCIQGVFEVLKEPGVSMAIGDTILWDNTNNVAVDVQTGYGGYVDSAPLGKCVKAALSTDNTVMVAVHYMAHTIAG